MIRSRENRLHEARQYPEALHEHSRAGWDAEEILDDHVEALAVKPVEGIQHRRGRPVHPSLIHIHGHKLMQKRAVFRFASAGVLPHHIIGRIEMEAMLVCYPASDGRFSRAAAASDPVHMAQLLA